MDSRALLLDLGCNFDHGGKFLKEEQVSLPMNYPAETSTIRFYHAHVYYDLASRPAAERLRAEIEQRFEVVIGRWRDEPVGPHPQPMYQVKFDPPEFARIVPWLMLNRAGLTMLVHPDTGNAVADHAINALWLGQKLDLRIDVLRRMAGA